MNYRNPKYNAVGTIDCEVEHPVHGWVPFTANPDDSAGSTVYAEIMSAGGIGSYTPLIVNISVITKLQHIEQLEAIGLEDAFFRMMDDNVTTKRKFDAATELNINHPLVRSFATAFGWDSDRLQQHFNDAGA
jgi:hypothetical protein